MSPNGSELAKDTRGNVWRRLARGMAAATLVVGALLALVVLAVQVPAVGTRLANLALGRVLLPEDVELTVRAVRGNWLTRLDLLDLRLRRDGVEIVAVGRLGVRGWRVAPGRIGAGDVAIDDLRLDPGGGAWIEPVSFSARDVVFEGGLSLDVESLGLRYHPTEADEPAIDVWLAASLDRGILRIDPVRVSGPRTSVTGRARWTIGRTDSTSAVEFTLRAAPLALEDLAPFGAGSELAGAVQAGVELSGPSLDRLSGRVSMTTDGARVAGLTLGPSRLAAEIVNGEATFDVTTEWEQAGVAGRGTVRPFVTIPEYDVTVRLDRAPRRLPGAPWWEEAVRRNEPAATRVHVKGEGFAAPVASVDGEITSGSGRVDFRGSVRSRPGLAWEMERLTFENVDVAAWLGDSTASALTGTIAARGEGAGPESLRVSGEWELAPSRVGRWDGLSGGGTVTLSGPRLGASLRVAMDGAEVVVDSLSGTLSDRPVIDIATLRLRNVDLARLTGRPQLGERSIERANARLALRDGELRFRAAVHTDAGRVEVDGIAHPFDPRPSVDLAAARFVDVNAAAWTGSSRPTRLSGRLSGSASIGGAPEGAPGVASWSGELQLDASGVGEFRIMGGEVSARASDGRIDGRGSLRTNGGEVGFAADVTDDGTGRRGRVQLDAPFSVLAHLAGRDTLATTGGLHVDATFAGDGPGLPPVAAEVTAHGLVAEWSVESLLAALRFADGVLSIDTLAVRSTAGAVDASGRVALAASAPGSTSDLHLALETTDPSLLRTLARADAVTLDEARVDAHLAGTATEASVTARIGLRSFGWGAVSADDLQVDATAELVGGALGFDVSAAVDDARSARLAGRASRDTTGVGLLLTALELQEGSASPWRLARPASLRFGEERLRVDSLEVHCDSGALRAHGVLDRHGSQDFGIRLDGVELGALTSWLGRDDLGGRLDGELAVSGPADAPLGGGFLRAAVVAAGSPAGVAEAHVDWDGRAARMRASFVSPERDSLTAFGHLPLALTPSGSTPETDPVPWLAGDLDLRVVATRFPLSALGPLLPASAASTVAGMLDANLRFHGRGRELRGEGSIAIVDGMLAVPALGVAYRDCQLEAALTEDRIALRRARVRSGTGELDVTGDVHLVGRSRVEPKITATARDFVLLDTADLRLVASGEARVVGTLTEPVVSGRLVVARCVYYLTDAVVSGAQFRSDVTLTPADLAMLEENFGMGAPTAPSPALALWDRTDLDIDVILDRDNWLRRRVAPRIALQLTGEVRARKPPHGELDLRGRVTPVRGRGYIEHFGRTFEFTGGEVLLNGPMDRHSADVRTQYRVGARTGSDDEVVVHLDAHASQDELRLVLSSEPPMSETEIVSYIATGRRSSGSTGKTDAAMLAAEVGLSQVTGTLQDAVKDPAKLDVLMVRYDPQLGATVVAGRYVGPNVYVGLRQPIQYREKGERSSQDPFQTTAELDYQLSRWLALNLQGEVSLLRAFLRATHEY